MHPAGSKHPHKPPSGWLFIYVMIISRLSLSEYFWVVSI